MANLSGNSEIQLYFLIDCGDIVEGHGLVLWGTKRSLNVRIMLDDVVLPDGTVKPRNNDRLSIAH